MSDVASVQEREKFQSNLEFLIGSNFNLPIALNEAFDLCVYNHLIEEKLKDGLFELRCDMEMGGGTTMKMLKMQKDMLAKQFYINAELTSYLQKEINGHGHSFNVKEKMKQFMSALRTQRNNRAGRRKQLNEANAYVEQMLSEVNDMISGVEPIE